MSGSGMSLIRQRAVDGLQVGDSFSVSRTFTDRNVLEFAEISRDFNPVHFDQRFAGVKKLKRPICHGLLVASLVTEIGGQIGWLASGMRFRFKRPVYCGDTVTCELTITEIGADGRAEAEAVLTNGSGQIVMECGLSGILPGDAEKRIMQAMLAEDASSGERNP